MGRESRLALAIVIRLSQFTTALGQAMTHLHLGGDLRSNRLFTCPTSIPYQPQRGHRASYGFCEFSTCRIAFLMTRSGSGPTQSNWHDMHVQVAYSSSMTQPPSEMSPCSAATPIG